MKVPSYLKEKNYKIMEQDKAFSAITIMSRADKENKGNNELFEIYYFGELFWDNMIRGIFEEENGTKIPCKIVAKSIGTGEEIILFDEAKYGYNSLFCDEFDQEKVLSRELTKLDIPNSKIRVEFGYGIDYEEEKEDYEVDENDCLESINGEMISWEEVKKNGFDFIHILAIDEKEIIREICELELA